MNAGKANRVADYVDAIISAISKIQDYSHGLDLASFSENQMAQDAIIRRFEVIGEAARRILTADPDFVQRYPALELDAAYRMRNALAHGYDSVNLQTVWDTIEQRLPTLKTEALRVLHTEFGVRQQDR